MLRNSLFDRLVLFFGPADGTSGGIMEDEPNVDLEDDDKDDGEEGEEDKEDDEEADKDEEEDEEGEEKDKKEEEEPVLARVEFKEIKGKYPQFFKDFPDLKHAFFREQQFSEIFPTVEDARKAAEIENAYNDITSAIVSGDANRFLHELKGEGDESLKTFSGNFLPAVRNLNKDLYFDIVAPEVQQFIKNVYSHGDKGKDENVKNAAKIVHKILFGGAYDDIEGETSLINGDRTPKDETVEKDKQNYFAGKYRALAGEVTKNCYDALDAEISKGLEDLAKQPGLRKIIAKEVRGKILEQMDKDSLYLGRMNANWKKEQRNGFSGAHKNAFLALFLAKAKTLVPKVRSEVRKETLGKSDGKDEKDKREPTRVSGGGESRGGSKGGKMTIERAKKENLSTRQVFDD
jgi:hypothetical protein